MKILLELRPALNGYAGIPQETRLLFCALNSLDDIEVDGLIQSCSRVLAKPLPAGTNVQQHQLSIDQQINCLSRVVISLQPDPKPKLLDRISAQIALVLSPSTLFIRHLMGQDQPLGKFDATHFKDFIWRSMFERTLPVEHFNLVTDAGFRVCRVPWSVMHVCALLTHQLGHALYPRLDTSDFDVMITETPYPATVSKRTTLVVRYHDAIPVLMPHTINNRSMHQASHYQALRKNVASGAYFACVSDTTRKDLISIFPQAQERSVTIYNMLSPHYFDDTSQSTRVPGIIQLRMHTWVSEMTSRQQHFGLAADDASQPLEYLLMVSTIEPRKNHATLLSAWEQLRADRFPDLKLIIVGMLGWDYLAIVNKCKPWLERGQVFMLEDVLPEELRLLYKHARATVCPSFGEGFDFSGVEAMRCGGVVAASNIAAHLEVYAEAAQYFSPYSATEAASAIAQVIDPAEPTRRQELVQAGADRSKKYLPEVILPKWHDFFSKLSVKA